jgi:hypothetical protein
MIKLFTEDIKAGDPPVKHLGQSMWVESKPIKCCHTTFKLSGHSTYLLLIKHEAIYMQLRSRRRAATPIK